jgi:trehalose/maltose hydrolase-like predicted phosphorylase
MSGWSLVYDGFDPAQEPLREALCTLGNGYFATRGAVPEAAADDVHYPGTYVAGLFDRLTTPIAGRDVENEDLVNAPNWLPFSFRRPDHDWWRVGDADLLEYQQELDLRQGVLTRTWRTRDDEGRVTSVRQRRLVAWPIRTWQPWRQGFWPRTGVGRWRSGPASTALSPTRAWPAIASCTAITSTRWAVARPARMRSGWR